MCDTDAWHNLRKQLERNVPQGCHESSSDSGDTLPAKDNCSSQDTHCLPRAPHSSPAQLSQEDSDFERDSSCPKDSSSSDCKRNLKHGELFDIAHRRRIRSRKKTPFKDQEENSSIDKILTASKPSKAKRKPLMSLSSNQTNAQRVPRSAVQRSPKKIPSTTASNVDKVVRFRQHHLRTYSRLSEKQWVSCNREIEDVIDPFDVAKSDVAVNSVSYACRQDSVNNLLKPRSRTSKNRSQTVHQSRTKSQSKNRRDHHRNINSQKVTARSCKGGSTKGRTSKVQLPSLGYSADDADADDENVEQEISEPEDDIATDSILSLSLAKIR